MLSCSLPYLEIRAVVLLYQELSILQGADREEWDKQEEVAGQFPAAGGGLAGLCCLL